MVRAFLGILLFMATHSAMAHETVVLLHGLARTSRCMAKMERSLIAEGYHVLNLGYPSRKHPVEALATMVRSQIVAQAPADHRIHFVTHSLGGIVVRCLQRQDPLPNVGRIVMLSPPNHGSEVVDALGEWRAFRWLNGPAGSQLGTAQDGFIASLGPLDMEVGIITGDRSINWILSRFITGPDDGKVSVESARMEGMRDFLVVPVTHPYMMKRRRVIEATCRFLRSGSFRAAGNPLEST